MLDSSVVDKNVDGAKVLFGVANESRALCRVREIRGMKQHIYPMLRPQSLGQRFGLSGGVNRTIARFARKSPKAMPSCTDLKSPLSSRLVQVALQVHKTIPAAASAPDT